MRPRTRTALSFAAVALIALAFTAAPGGGDTLQVILRALSVAFFASLGFFGYRLYRENTLLLESLTDVQRTVLYGSTGGAFLVFASRPRLDDWVGSAAVIVFIVLLGLCSYGLYWVWVSSRDYG